MALALDPFERAVLEKIFSGSQPIIAALREQLANLEVVERELTGVGFLTSFRVRNCAPRAATKADRIRFGDVVADIEGLEHGAGFVVSIADGYLEILEGYSFDEPWPSVIARHELRYQDDHDKNVLALFGP